MPTALQLIESAALKLGAIESGESLTADEANDSLDVLNSMLDFWAIDKFFVYQVVQAQHSWPGATSSRTIGSGGNFNVTRPNRVEDGTFFRDSGNNDQSVIIVRNREVYDSLPSKTDQGTFPEFLFYDPGFPLGTLYVYPVPANAMTLFLNSWQVLQSFSALTTSLSLPPGYQWLIENNLAVNLEAVFNLPVPESVKSAASNARAKIGNMNTLPVFSATDANAALGGYGGSNILTG